MSIGPTSIKQRNKDKRRYRTNLQKTFQLPALRSVPATRLN